MSFRMHTRMAALCFEARVFALAANGNYPPYWASTAGSGSHNFNYPPTTRNRGFSISPTAFTPARRGESIRWA
jgi:hypothetical protein